MLPPGLLLWVVPVTLVSAFADQKTAAPLSGHDLKGLPAQPRTGATPPQGTYGVHVGADGRAAPISLAQKEVKQATISTAEGTAMGETAEVEAAKTTGTAKLDGNKLHVKVKANRDGSNAKLSLYANGTTTSTMCCFCESNKSKAGLDLTDKKLTQNLMDAEKKLAEACEAPCTKEEYQLPEEYEDKVQAKIAARVQAHFLAIVCDVGGTKVELTPAGDRVPLPVSAEDEEAKAAAEAKATAEAKAAAEAAAEKAKAAPPADGLVLGPTTTEETEEGKEDEAAKAAAVPFEEDAEPSETKPAATPEETKQAAPQKDAAAKAAEAKEEGKKGHASGICVALVAALVLA